MKRFIAIILVALIVLTVAGCSKETEYKKVGPTPVLTTTTTTTETTTAEKTTAEKTTAEKTTAEKTTAEKTTAEKTTAEKTTAEKTTQGEYKVYTVKSGDNYYSILRACGVADTPANVQKLCDYNGISIYSGLAVGQKIKVPASF